MKKSTLFKILLYRKIIEIKKLKYKKRRHTSVQINIKVTQQLGLEFFTLKT